MLVPEKLHRSMSMWGLFSPLAAALCASRIQIVFGPGGSWRQKIRLPFAAVNWFATLL